ncbi:unnamed protein product [Urochloa decumbens]|uniref:Xylanase inhibitor C-terminal domain-containing protein n=1 Tax=Urochloa decumbens TaxID=240449 RepID=A0ABC9B7N6_9POAL
MASVAKLLLLVLCSYHTLVAHAGGGRSLSYTVLSFASLNNSGCSDRPKYVITVRLGTPALTQTMFIDTGMQRRVVGAVQDVLAVPLPGRPALRPQRVQHLLPLLLRLRRLRAARHGGERLLQLPAVPVHAQRRGVRAGVRRPNRRAHGARRRRAVSRLADGGDVRLGLLLLPPADERLQAIRVGGAQLNIPTSAFSAGAIMDSGTVVTRLPRTAYSALSSAFKAGMKRYRRAPASGILDTCFNFKGQTSISIPTVALVFSGGAVVNLDPNGVMLDNCLAFAGNSDDTSLGIIGNVQQRTFEVLYNVGGGAVGFRPGAC